MAVGKGGESQFRVQGTKTPENLKATIPKPSSFRPAWNCVLHEATWLLPADSPPLDQATDV